MLALNKIYKTLIQDLTDYRKMRGFYETTSRDLEDNSPILNQYQISEQSNDENKSVMEALKLGLNNVGKTNVLSTQKAQIAFN